MKRIGVIIVLYNDKPQGLYNNFAFEGEIIVVDNTPGQDLKLSYSNITYIPLLKNKGIATAQNIGISKAIELGCEYVLFLDQDSVVDTIFIKRIYEEYIRIKSVVSNLFALGPTSINGRTNEEYKPVFREEKVDENGFIKKNEIISSGSCIEVKLIAKVGFLNESLFIDYVDNEWIWRANSIGYVSGITKNVKMTHYIGQNDVMVFNYPLRISSTKRYYYQSRNYLWLLPLKYVPLHWKITSFIKLFVLPLFLPFKINGCNDIYKNIARGIKDGLFKRNQFKSNEF